VLGNRQDQVSFGEGILGLSKKRGLGITTKLTAQLKQEILECLEFEKSLSCDLNENRFEAFMFAANWLESRLNKSKPLSRMSPLIGKELFNFAVRNQFSYPLAMSWVKKQVNSYYSVFELTNK